MPLLKIVITQWKRKRGGKRMLKKMNSEYISWIILVGAVILLLEVTFFKQGLIFSLFISILMVYLGRKSMPKKMGKLLFWGGTFLLIINIFQMMTFRFLLLAIFIYFVLQFAQSKRVPSIISPVVGSQSKSTSSSRPKEQVVERKPLFQNLIFGQQKTPDHVYEWNDINIQTGVGDSIIDLSYTVMPKGETVIYIRKLIGNVQIFVPYEYEISVRHSVLAGTTTVLDFNESKMFNEVFHLETPEYEDSDKKIKIITSIALGDLEVKRI
jgi:lia operon protein LiaF